MADFDVIVIGGGPAGYTAALAAAERGATVALAEIEQPGGACVNFACIPTNALLDCVGGFLTARGLAGLGVLSAGEQLLLGRAADRKNAVVRSVATNVRTALTQRGVRLLHGHAALTGPQTLRLQGDDAGDLRAEAIVLASGTRWRPLSIPGLSSQRLLTADQVLDLRTAPASALVLGDGPAGFALEYACLLAAAGATVTLVCTGQLLPGFDAALTEAATAVLTDLGVMVLTEARCTAAREGTATVHRGSTTESVTAEVLVAVDCRVPFSQGLGLEAAGVAVNADGALPVDRACRTSSPALFAAGDVTGGSMLSAAAIRMGHVAGENATGAESHVPNTPLPRLLHTQPQIGWVGLSEARARDAGHAVCTGVVDLGYSPRALVLGHPLGAVKLVADRTLGEILGVHVVGPEASEILAAAVTAIQAELTLDDLAAVSHWHPSIAESLSEAARRALKAASR